MTTYALQQGTSTTTVPRHAHVTGHGIASNSAGVIFEVPMSQLYYWSRVWQENERAAVDELARGEGRRFENSKDAIRWLLDGDDA